MWSGDVYVINIDRLVIDFMTEYTKEDVFPAEKVLNFEEWRKYENFVKVVR